MAVAIFGKLKEAMKSLETLQQSLRSINPKTEILAVSKLQSAEKIRTLHSLGQTQFGENYVQEALDKQKSLEDLSLQWHFIGRLQKNKIKFVLGNFSLIHSVDSVELAKAIDRKASERGLIQEVLLQMNLASEESKGGFDMPELEKSLVELGQLKSIRLRGLMTMPPLFDNPESARPYFKKLFNIHHQLQPQFPQMTELSMGTSSDYLIAAEEGSTLVRLGTLLFGDRPAKINP